MRDRGGNNLLYNSIPADAVPAADEGRKSASYTGSFFPTITNTHAGGVEEVINTNFLAGQRNFLFGRPIFYGLVSWLDYFVSFFFFFFFFFK